jgi:uncharacterized membrane protein YfcA
MSVVAAALVLVGGMMIGAVGIGGVLVVPALTDAAGVPLGRAIAASMAGFLATGIVAAGSSRNRTARSTGLWPLNLAALAGAVIGAAVVDLIPGAAIRLFIAAVAIASGTHALVPRRATYERPNALSAPALGSIGVLVGCGSALSGTGGPVMLLPILLFCGVPVRAGIAMAQVVQLPIALSATAVNAAQGRLDPLLGALAAGLLVVGSVAGMWLAARVETSALKRAVAIGLVALGLWYVYATFVDRGGAS